ncbi:synaptonemal complex central element protein 1-like isoform X2 [Cavia porcellus]|uniref:synaptonemal complex central element protein 1-like isoform X2 n=1 Tax=Cavia porcellus TaxID=10141 RepID=UPI002FE2FF5E
MSSPWPPAQSCPQSPRGTSFLPFQMGLNLPLLSLALLILVFISAGQAGFLKKPEDLLSMVEKLQKEGTLEPQIEDLIHRIYKLQQAKKKSGEELGETQALWEALNRELDSLNGENLHLEEVLNKKQGRHLLPCLLIPPLLHQPPFSRRAGGASLSPGLGCPLCSDLCLSGLLASRVLGAPCDLGPLPSAHTPLPRQGHQLPLSSEALRILQQHRQAQESGAPRSAAEEQLKDPVARHKALWEFRVLEQRLAREIRALERSQEQLRAQGSLVRARLQEVEQRLRPAPELGGAPAATGGPEAEIQSLERRSRSAPGAKDGGKGPGQTWRSCGEVRGSSAPQLRDLTAQPRACCSQASDAEGEPEPQAEPAPTPPKAAAAPRPGFREADPK